MGVGGAERAPCETFADDGGARRALPIVGGQPAAAQQRNLERVEIARGNRVDLRGQRRRVSSIAVADRPITSIPFVSTLPLNGGIVASVAASTPPIAAIRVNTPRYSGPSASSFTRHRRRVDRRDDDAPIVEAGVDAAEVPQAPQEQRRAREQHARERDLNGREQAASAALTARDDTTAGRKRIPRLAPRGEHGGHHPDEERGQRRDGDREREHAAIRFDRQHAGQPASGR